MNPRSFSDEGIVLTRRNYGEADRIISLYTKSHGRIATLAKGIRKPGSRKRGHLEVFSHVRLQISNGKGLGLITEAEMINSFNPVRKNLKKVALAYYFMEVVGKMTHEHEPNRELFDLILEFMNRLKNQWKLKILRLDFVLRLLTLLGFWPKDKLLVNPDAKLEETIERQINSLRVGKRLFVG